MITFYFLNVIRIFLIEVRQSGTENSNWLEPLTKVTYKKSDVTKIQSLPHDVIGNLTIDCLYDNEGRPYQITVKEGTKTYTGYSVLNRQRDVIAILNTSEAAVVTYTYDA